MKYTNEEICMLLELDNVKKASNGKYFLDEEEVAKKLFNCKILKNDLNTNKIYYQRLYTDFFIEFDNINDYNEWLNWCEENIYYSFYDAYVCFNLKAGDRNDFINQFIVGDEK